MQAEILAAAEEAKKNPGCETSVAGAGDHQHGSQVGFSARQKEISRVQQGFSSGTSRNTEHRGPPVPEPRNQFRKTPKNVGSTESGKLKRNGIPAARPVTHQPVSPGGLNTPSNDPLQGPACGNGKDPRLWAINYRLAMHELARASPVDSSAACSSSASPRSSITQDAAVVSGACSSQRSTTAPSSPVQNPERPLQGRICFK